MSESREAGPAGFGGSDIVLKSVGIDIGSSTTHLTMSELVVGRRDSHFHRKAEVLDRRVTYRSPILFTPFLSEGTIDHQAVLDFVQNSYREAGVSVAEIDSGAVICTGEAARRRNAQVLTETLARDGGKFVCATAGHHFEALLAAHGSGSVEASHYFDGATINLDIGGGTTKRSLIRDGVIEHTAAINIGARLIEFSPDGRIRRSEPAAQVISRHLGIEVTPGCVIDFDRQHALAGLMAKLLMEFLGIAPMSALAGALLLTDPPPPLPDTLITTSPPRCVPKPIRLICSGGVSEFLYRRADIKPDDLGPLLGHALRQEIYRHLPDEWLLTSREGIRATVIGACQFTLQASGDTIYVSSPAVLPLSNVPVLSVPVDWRHVTAETVAAAIVRALSAADQADACALFFGGPRQFGYGRLTHLARGIAEGCRQRPSTRTHVFVFSHNIANTLGYELRRHLPPDLPFLCLDEIELGNLDYLDIGLPPPGETYLPVVVKSLVFQSAATPAGAGP
jgi:ethanolamine utilization protein EutA